MGLQHIMGLQQMVQHAIRGAIDKVRRSAIAYGVCAVCAMAALVLLTVAGVVALIPLTSTIYALLIAACFYLLVVAGVLLWMHQPNAGHPAAPPHVVSSGAETIPESLLQRQAQFAQIAMLVEAVALGYSLSRKR
jgi:threonine/homoserine/homoserine lactone efflux protein